MCPWLKKVRSCGEFDSHSCSAGYKSIPWVTPMKLLHIDSSVLGPHSVSRQVSAAIVDRLQAGDALARHRLSRPDPDPARPPLRLASRGRPRRARAGGTRTRPRRERGGAERVPRRRHRRDRRAHVQFYDSEPAQGLDRSRAGGGKDVQIWRERTAGPCRRQARDRGDLARRLLRPGHAGRLARAPRNLFARRVRFMGITSPEFIVADGIQVGPEHREKALAGALQAATSLRAA